MSDWLLVLLVSVPLLVGELAALAEVALARSDLSWLRRLAWLAFLIVVPYVSLAAYLVVRPSRADRALARPAAGGDQRAAELVLAAERHAAGELSDDDYDRAVSSSVSGWNEAATRPSAADR